MTSVEKKSLSDTYAPLKKPSWLRKPIIYNARVAQVCDTLKNCHVNTVCSSALCPNRSECFSKGTATFLVMGSTCTRQCRFCNIGRGRPGPLDSEEPERVARVVEKLGIRHAVVTSVTRDDLEDRGAEHLVKVTLSLKSLANTPTVELLIPDFGGSMDSLQKIIDVRPDIVSHNLDTVQRLFPTIKPHASYWRSLELLKRAADAGNGYFWIKSGLMLGMGEEIDEVTMTLDDLYNTGCRIVTLGQYLAPSPGHFPVQRYLSPEEFDSLGTIAKSIGFTWVHAGVFQRSSYYAESIFLNMMASNNRQHS